MTNKASVFTSSNIELLNKFISDNRANNFHVVFYRNRVKLVLLGRKLCLTISKPTLQECIDRMNERLYETWVDVPVIN